MRKARGAIDFDLPETQGRAGRGRAARRGWSSASARRATGSSRSACSPPTRRWRSTSRSAGLPIGLPVPRRAGRGEAGGVRRAGAGVRLQAARGRTESTSHGAERLHAASWRATPEQRALNQLLLRSMMQAVYSADERGALRPGGGALPALHLAHPPLPGPAGAPAAQGALGAARASAVASASWSARRSELRAAWPCSARSASARPCRWSARSSSFYATLLMKDRVGEEFDATVSGAHRLRLLRGAGHRARRGAGEGGDARARREAGQAGARAGVPERAPGARGAEAARAAGVREPGAAADGLRAAPVRGRGDVVARRAGCPAAPSRMDGGAPARPWPRAGRTSRPPGARGRYPGAAGGGCQRRSAWPVLA